MSEIKKKLLKIGLRPTIQRIAILDILLKQGNVDVCAAKIKDILEIKKKSISTATIYNNLNELSRKGFLKKVQIEKDKMWFDTNLSEHHHFYDEEKDQLTDIDEKQIEFSRFPNLPKGKRLKSLSIIIKVQSKK